MLDPAPYRLAMDPFTMEVNLGLAPQRRAELEPELMGLLHETFLDHSDYDRLYLPHFLGADIYLRAFRGQELAGIFIAGLAVYAGEPLLFLILGMTRPEAGSNGRLMPLATGVCLRLASLRPRLCGPLFGLDRCSFEGAIFRDSYPVAPWHGQAPQHHDEAVNRFCREHLGPRDAFLFLGPTLPPLAHLPGKGAAWPENGWRGAG